MNKWESIKYIEPSELEQWLTYWMTYHKDKITKGKDVNIINVHQAISTMLIEALKADKDLERDAKMEAERMASALAFGKRQWDLFNDAKEKLLATGRNTMAWQNIFGEKK